MCHGYVVMELPSASFEIVGAVASGVMPGTWNGSQSPIESLNLAWASPWKIALKAYEPDPRPDWLGDTTTALFAFVSTATVAKLAKGPVQPLVEKRNSTVPDSPPWLLEMVAWSWADAGAASGPLTGFPVASSYTVVEVDVIRS